MAVERAVTWKQNAVRSNTHLSSFASPLGSDGLETLAALLDVAEVEAALALALAPREGDVSAVSGVTLSLLLP